MKNSAKTQPTAKSSVTTQGQALAQTLGTPSVMLDAAQVFNLPPDRLNGKKLLVPSFAERSDYVPEIDATYCFDPDTTLAILAGFAHNRRVLIQGFHGTGKSTHIEQVAARLNWPCVRVNLDSHISRIDLIGKDAIVLEDGRQVTEFREGILPWALQNPVALVFDEYDAGRPDVMFVIQRVLEVEGQINFARSKPDFTAASLFPLVCHREYGWFGRYVGALSRHPANQPRTDGSLEHCRPPQLFAARDRGSDYPRQSQRF